jgi:hypothetical protein
MYGKLNACMYVEIHKYYQYEIEEMWPGIPPLKFPDKFRNTST